MQPILKAVSDSSLGGGDIKGLLLLHRVFEREGRIRLIYEQRGRKRMLTAQRLQFNPAMLAMKELHLHTVLQ